MLIRDKLREQVRDNTAARTNVTLGHLLDEWLSGHEVEETTRATYRLLINSFIRPVLGALPWASYAGRVRAPSSSFTWNSERAAVAATAAPLSSTAHLGSMSVTSGAQRMCASPSPRRPFANATPCSVAR